VSFFNIDKIKSSKLALSFEYDAAILTLHKTTSLSLGLSHVYTHFLASNFSLKIPLLIISKASFSFIPYKLNISFIQFSHTFNISRKISSIFKSISQISLILFSVLIKAFLYQFEKLL
jgi:hypothetical protein